MHLLNYKPLNLIILTKTEKFAISREIPGPGVEKDGKSQFPGITFGWEIENPKPNGLIVDTFRHSTLITVHILYQ